MIKVKSNRAEQVKGGWVLPAQARKGGGSKVADSEPRPLLRVQGAKVALAKVSAASRKVRVQPHFVSLASQLKMGRGKRAGHWRAVVLSQIHIDDGTGDWSWGGTLIPHPDDGYLWRVRRAGDPDIYDYYDVNTYFSTDRHHIFRYGIYAHHGKRADGTDDFGGYTAPNNNLFMICDMKLIGEPAGRPYSFMHELGHTLNIPPEPQWVDTDLGSEYKSVMNYHSNYEHEILNYYTGWFHDPTNNDQWTYVDEWRSVDPSHGL